MQDYKGNIDYEELRPEPSNVFHLVLRFAPPYKVRVTEEYIIYDIIKFINLSYHELGKINDPQKLYVRK